MTGAGAYGKIPGAGDFVRLGLPRDFIQSWDAWLQPWFAAARNELGEQWNDCYLSAPIWRFTAAGGLLDQGIWLGVCAASVDRVGRQFPLCLAVPLDREADPDAAHFGNGALFEALEKIVIGSLGADWDAETLRRSLSSLPAATTPHLQQSGAAVWIASDRDALTSSLAALQLRETAGTSLWSSDDGHRVRLFRADGMPDLSVAPAFFDMRHALWTTLVHEFA